MKIKKLLLIQFILILVVILPIESFAQKKKQTKAKRTVVVQKGNLNIEAGIVFTSGDVKPVARVEFYLLDADAEKILKDTYGESASLKSITLDLNFPLFETNGVQKALTAIKPHIIASARTDFQGKTNFSSIKVGNYYLFGFVKNGRTSLVWNINTAIKGGINSLIVDNNNAALISDR